MLHPLWRVIKKYATYLPMRQGSFRFEDRQLPYFCHFYNQTWMNELCVEVALAMSFVQPGLRILEVGRVLDHYTNLPHDCVDKFEKGALNVDVVDFKPSSPYDLILSLSTLEHVGWDENRDPVKIHIAIKHLHSLLKPGGRMVATVPTGYNENLDADLKNGVRLFDEQYYFTRKPSGRWVQTHALELLPYNFRDGWANAFILGVSRA